MAEDNKPNTQSNDGSKSVPPKSNNNKTLIIVLAVVAVIVILPVIVFSVFAFWLSRGDNATDLTEGIIESATGSTDVEINKDGSSFNIETDEGSISVGEQKLPDNLPSAVVIYENQKVVSVITNNQDGSKVWSFTSESSDDATKVNEYLVTKFAENGWTAVSTSTYNTTTSYSLTKDNLTAQISVTAGESGEPTTITYYVSEETTP